MGSPTTTAVVTGILTCAALVVGAVAFPVVKTEPTPVVETVSAPAPAERPGLEPQIDLGREDEILARLERVEKALDALRTEAGGMLGELEPLVALAREVHTQRVPRKRANETAAIATLRNIISAQAQMQATGRIDVDSDGTGEYGGFLELSGGVAGRMQRPLVPPVLSSAFRTLIDGEVVVRSGYCFRIFLPGARGSGVAEPAVGFAPGHVDPDLSETTWCCYAWPLEPGAMGDRTYFTNQGGDVTACADARYGGTRGGPNPEAAFFRGPGIVGQAAIGRSGGDGNTWVQVN